MKYATQNRGFQYYIKIMMTGQATAIRK